MTDHSILDQARTLTEHSMLDTAFLRSWLASRDPLESCEFHGGFNGFGVLITELTDGAAEFPSYSTWYQNGLWHVVAVHATGTFIRAFCNIENMGAAAKTIGTPE